MLKRTSEQQAREFLKLAGNNRQTINRRKESMRQSKIIMSGLSTGLPPVMSSSPALSDILRHNPISNKSRKLVVESNLRASSFSLHSGFHTLDPLNQSISAFKPRLVSLDAAMRQSHDTAASTQRHNREISQNPRVSPSYSQIHGGLPPILSPVIPKAKQPSQTIILRRNDSLPPVIMEKKTDEEKFQEQFQKKYSPFLQDPLKPKRLSRSMLETPQLDNIKSNRRYKDEEEMRRQAKLAEVKMRNNLLKNKDFRKILKNYLKKNHAESPPPLMPSPQGLLASARSGSFQEKQGPGGKGNFYVHSTLNRKSPVMAKEGSQQFKFLPPFPISINVDPTAIESKQQLTGKVKIQKKSKVEEERRESPVEEEEKEVLKNAQLKGILKQTSMMRKERSIKDLRLPKVTFKLEGGE